MLNELLNGALMATPGYIQGRQQAIKDNWTDLNQLNQVQAGQLNNLFNASTFDDRWNMSRDQRLASTRNLQNLLNQGVLNDIDTGLGVATRAATAPYAAPIAGLNAQNGVFEALNVIPNAQFAQALRWNRILEALSNIQNITPGVVQ